MDESAGLLIFQCSSHIILYTIRKDSLRTRIIFVNARIFPVNSLLPIPIFGNSQVIDGY